MRAACLLVLVLASCGDNLDGGPVLVPEIDGEFWNVASTPDLGALNGPGQQPVDFAIWQAADGTWHIWSCIRFTSVGGNSRLFFHWQGASLTDTDWTPVGVAMTADPNIGEAEGGLQAPFVVRDGAAFEMFYGAWQAICRATSADGKTFTRALDANGQCPLFTEGPVSNTRDPMVLKIGDRWHIYYTAFADDHGETIGSVYLRTSPDLQTWSASRVVAYGGAAGSGGSAAECPYVVAHDGHFYLFRTQKYGGEQHSMIYRSADPAQFGIDDDRDLVGEIAVAAPEIFDYQGETYIAALKPTMDGIHIARLRWVAR